MGRRCKLPAWVRDYVRRELRSKASTVGQLARLLMVDPRTIANIRTGRFGGVAIPESSFAFGEARFGAMHAEHLLPAWKQPDIRNARNARDHRRRSQDEEWVAARREAQRVRATREGVRKKHRIASRDWKRRARTKAKAPPAFIPNATPRGPRPRRTPGDQVIAPGLLVLMRNLVRAGHSHREVERRTGIGRKRIPKILARAA